MNRKGETTAFDLVCIVFCLGMVVALFPKYSEEVGRADIRTECVKMGMAEWRADKDGNASFSWKKFQAK